MVKTKEPTYIYIYICTPGDRYRLLRTSGFNFGRQIIKIRFQSITPVSNKNVDIVFHTHGTFLENLSSGTLKVKLIGSHTNLNVLGPGIPRECL